VVALLRRCYLADFFRWPGVFCRRRRCPPPGLASPLWLDDFLLGTPACLPPGSQGRSPSKLPGVPPFNAAAMLSVSCLLAPGTFTVAPHGNILTTRLASQRRLKQPGWPSLLLPPVGISTSCGAVAPGLLISPEPQCLGPCSGALLASLAGSMLGLLWLVLAQRPQLAALTCRTPGSLLSRRQSQAFSPSFVYVNAQGVDLLAS
jgi:hypothetical protein